MKDYYKILEISENASEEVVHMAYKALVKKYHPDENNQSENSKDKMVELNEAYFVLSDQKRREQYDCLRKEENSSSGVHTKKENIEPVTQKEVHSNVENGYKKRWYYSYPVIILTYCSGILYPLSLILTILRFAQRKKQDKGYRIRTNIIFGIHVFCALSIVFALWTSKQEEKWNKEFNQYMLDGNYNEAAELLSKHDSSMNEETVMNYLNLYENAQIPEDITDIVTEYYNGLSDKTTFSENVEGYLQGILWKMPEEQQEKASKILSDVERQKKEKAESIAMSKAVESSSMMESSEASAETEQASENTETAESNPIVETSEAATETEQPSENIETTETNSIMESSEADHPSISEKNQTQAADITEKADDSGNSRLEYTIQAIKDSTTNYSYFENPYLLASLKEYLELINQSYAGVGSNQRATIISMEEALREAKISKSLIKKIMRLDGSEFFNNSDFVLMDRKDGSSVVGSLLGIDESRSSYYEVSSAAKSLDSLFDFYYVGKLKNNKPNGNGALFCFLSSTGMRLLYAGEFKDGRADGTGIWFDSTWFGYDVIKRGKYTKNALEGKGIKYNDTDITGVYKCYSDMLSEYSNGKFAEYPKEKQEEILKRIIQKNPACRMQFIEGLYQSDNTKVKIDIPVIKPIEEFNGKFKDDEYQDGRLYDYFGILSYDGTFKNQEYNGKGKLYYNGSSALKYKGNFRKGKYNGKGVLYNEDGSVRKKGEFKNEAPNTEQEKMAYSLASSITMSLYTTMTDKGVEYFFEPESMRKNQDDEYIFPNSDCTELTDQEISSLSQDEIRLATNEIYARHGYIFKDSTLKAYFESKSWYYGTIEPEDFQENMLNYYEKTNIEKLAAARK